MIVKTSQSKVKKAMQFITNEHSYECPAVSAFPIKSALTNNQLTLSLKNKKLMLGTWQGLYLFEHRLDQHTRILSHHLIGD